MEQQLKQRLVGAVVLVSLAVIFIPFILEGPDDELTPRYQELPEAPQIDYNASIELPLPAARPSAGKPSPVVQEEAAVEAPAVVPDPPPAAGPVPEPAPPAPAPPPEPAIAPQQPDTAVPPGWYAQVGSFSQHENASGLRDALSKAGHKAHVQQAATGSGHSYRVLVGPSASREAATRVLDKLAAGMQLQGLVIEMPAQ